MLTGEWYENDIPFQEYLNQSSLELSNKLKDNDYSAGVYTLCTCLSEAEDRYINVHSGKYKIKTPTSFVKTLYKLIAFEYLPHQFKGAFWVNTNDFESQKSWENKGKSRNVAYNLSAEKYYQTICKEGVQLTSETNCFRFVHLMGMHPPYIFGEDVIVDGREYTYMETLQGNMNVIKAFINHLQESEVYDNTAIMILADHGGGPLASEMNCNPLLLVKGFDEHHDFMISEKPISWENIFPSLLFWVSGKEQADAIWNISEQNRGRRYFYYSWDNSWQSEYMPLLIEYTIEGNLADKTATFTPTGNQFLAGETNADEVDGLLLPSNSVQNLFTEDNTHKILVDSESKDFQAIYVSGLGEIEKRKDGQTYAWSNGYCTYFKLNPEGEQNLPYTFTVNFDEIFNADISSEAMTTIYASVNGERVSAEELTESSISFTISAEALSVDIVDVIIFYPCYNQKTNRMLAINSVELKQQVPVRIEDCYRIDFDENGNFHKMVASGWNMQEETGIWTTEDSKIIFQADNDSGLVLQMQYAPLVLDIPTVVKLNGHEVCTLGQGNTGKFILPKEYLNPAIQVLEFLTEEALLPKEAGIGTDTRTLGIYVQNITIVDSNALFPINASFQSDSNTAEDYIVSGFSIPESWGTWMVGPESSMSFFVPDVQNDLLLTLECPIAYGEQHVSVYANDVLIDESVFMGNETRSIVIPVECMTDDRLNLCFVLPDASSPKEKEGTDERKLAIGISGLKLEKMK